MGAVTGGGPRVMVADDTKDVRELVACELRSRGYEVIEARNGLETVELAGRTRPDLILMDLSTPVLDGYEATRRLRARAETKDVPIVAVSAFCDSDNRRRALEAGCVECVAKPVDFGLLYRLLQKHLRIH